MTALIVEDENIAANRLEKLIQECGKGIDILDKLDTVRLTVSWLQNNPPPDILFLDIQLADGLCFEIFEKTNVEAPVIFTTSYDQYAIKAFKHNSIDYLLKPIDQEELKKALDKLDKMKHSLSHSRQFIDQAIINKMYDVLNKKPYKDRFVVKIGDHIKTVFTKDILFFESKEKTTFIKHHDGRKYIIDHTLDKLSEILDPEIFFRINRKYIISIHSFNDIIAWSNSRLKVQLKGEKGMDAIVAREKVPMFKNWLEGERGW